MTKARLNSFALWLVAAGLLLRALLPAGLMPQASPNGWTVIICSSAGSYAMILDESGQPAKSDTAANGLCAFACSLGQALLLTGLVFMAFGLGLPLPNLPRHRIGLAGFERQLPHQRGPPHVS